MNSTALNGEIIMELIVHRINTIEELNQVPAECGIEIDLRERTEGLILQHDPFRDGESFEEYLTYYNHGLLILNVKSERIEFKILDIIKKYNISNYFFLDSSFPMIYHLAKDGEKNIAVRFSEFEGLDTVLAMRGKVDWVWVDCFTRLPIDRNNYSILKDAGFKICLVSPELQGRDGDIERYKNYLKEEKILFDAICTKSYNINRWTE